VAWLSRKGFTADLKRLIGDACPQNQPADAGRSPVDIARGAQLSNHAGEHEAGSDQKRIGRP
jgi:hypothetical protein